MIWTIRTTRRDKAWRLLQPLTLKNRKRTHQIYAHAGTPIYWIVNLVDNQVEVYSNPQPRAREPGYRERRIYDLSNAVPIVIEGLTISEVHVSDIIPNTVED